ncbi:MAG: APC family permease [Chitinophagaceae bacterium]|nr:MAG: APC family permease [Chitinophagaceae bacterium]
MSHPVAAPQKLKSLQLAAVIFLTVSGGPYGLEPLLGQAGNAALPLLLLTPILWDVPTILTVLELNSLFPENGGYYQWVKRALGLRYGFYEGWWSWLYTFADLAIYPVLFVFYLGWFFPGIEAYKIPICLAIIWLSAGINIRGIVPVGRVSILLSGAVLATFFVLFAYALYHSGGKLSVPAPSFKGTSFTAVGLGLYTIMWNFIGWDNVTTYVDEVRKPVKAYLLSIALAFVAVVAIYTIATVIALNSGIAAGELEQRGFPALGALVGGPWLGNLIAAGGLASTLGLYSAVLLSVSRIPKAMAADGLLPAKLHALHPRWGSPWLSVLCCSLVVSGMIFWDFGELIVIDITLYGAALLLEYVSLIYFRIKAPQLHRPFRIPLGVPGLVLMALLPFAVYGVALTAAFMDEGGSLRPLLFALLALGSAELMFRVVRFFLKPAGANLER